LKLKKHTKSSAALPVVTSSYSLCPANDTSSCSERKESGGMGYGYNGKPNTNGDKYENSNDVDDDEFGEIKFSEDDLAKIDSLTQPTSAPHN